MIRRAGPWIAQRPRVSDARATTCHYCPLWMGAVWLSLGIVVLLTTGCASKTGAVATHNATPASERLAGTVRGSDATALVSGRTPTVGSSFSTRDAIDVPTPASAATSISRATPRGGSGSLDREPLGLITLLLVGAGAPGARRLTLQIP